MKDFQSILKESKKEFPTHKWIRIKVKENPYNPFSNVFFSKVINDSTVLKHKKYALYIHDTYLSIRSLKYKNYEPVKMILDSKLWIELYFIFNIDNTKSHNEIFSSLKEPDDKPF